MLQGGDFGESVLVPGKREESWLYLSATWQHDDLQMPPKENDRLDDETLEALGQWIDEGAPWPDPARVEAIRIDVQDEDDRWPANMVFELWLREAEDLYSSRAPK